MNRVFLLSPASCSGARGRMLMSANAGFALARQVRAPEGAPVAEVFSFLSGLYFRGKLAYARAFGRAPKALRGRDDAAVLIITADAGLCPADERITLDHLRAFSRVDVHTSNAAYRRPLEESARWLSSAIGRNCDVVLLGSIASPKYVDVLADIFGRRLRFPVEFVGRGDMSRGGLLLRCVAAGRELEYAPVVGAVRHGHRPPKLEPLRRSGRT